MVVLYVFLMRVALFQVSWLIAIFSDHIIEQRF